jgi:hypothetical protein
LVAAEHLALQTVLQSLQHVHQSLVVCQSLPIVVMPTRQFVRNAVEMQNMHRSPRLRP